MRVIARSASDKAIRSILLGALLIRDTHSLKGYIVHVWIRLLRTSQWPWKM